MCEKRFGHVSILYVSEPELHSLTRKLTVAVSLEGWMNSKSFGNADGLG